MRLYFHELKMGWKSLCIWILCVASVCAGCILLYNGLQDSLQEMAAAYSEMGAFSAAIGLDKVSIATMPGYYATEIALMHGLGGALFAAILGVGMLSKEESGHTSEFLNTFPISRTSVVMAKYMAVVTNVVLFNVICTLAYGLSIKIVGQEIPVKEFLMYHGLQIVMQLEIATLCFFISATSAKTRTGAALGLTILLFAADMMCRIIPAIKELKYITPFYYSNAADIFSSGKASWEMVAIGVAILAASLCGAVIVYKKRDLTT